MNLSLTDLLNKINIQHEKHVFFAFSIVIRRRDLAYCEATNSEMVSYVSGMINTTSCTVMNLSLTDLLNKINIQHQKNVFYAFWIDFRRQDLGTCEATNSGLL